MLLLLKCLLGLLAGFVGDWRVLYFTSQQCPPCRQMAPTIDRLANQGYPIEKLDIGSNLDLARQLGVQSTPTTVILDDDRLVARQAGIIGYVPLKTRLDQLLAENRGPGSGLTPAADGDHAARSQSTGASPAGFKASADFEPPLHRESRSLTPRQRALQATVRLKVSDATGSSFATGTVIHVHQEDALVVTCGHVFRGSQGQGRITVDVGFGTGNTATVPGELIDYDADNYDIALVTFKPGREIHSVPLAQRATSIDQRESMFTLGCDGGADPTFRDTRIKKVNRYSGVLKYDIVGRPVTGRSGGGLFDSAGHLIGICNAAVVDVDEGIYSGLPSIYWQLDRVRLAHLFEQPGSSTDLAAHPPAAPSSAAPSSANVNPQAELAPQSGGANSTRNSLAANQPANGPPATPLPTKSGHDSRTAAPEIILLVRAAGDPMQTETITISNPSSELLRAARAAADKNASDRLAQALARNNRATRLPDLPASAGKQWQDELRAQSPR